MLELKLKQFFPFIGQEQLNTYADKVEQANLALHEKTGAGKDFLGWVDLPHAITKKQLTKIQSVADEFRKLDAVVMIGIGGSYLGAKSVIEALHPHFKQKNPQIIYAGHNLSEDYLAELQDTLKNINWGIVVISKSGTTTEPAIAFRILKNQLESTHGKAEAAKRIVAITDKEKGALKQLATNEQYKTFIIPDDVGGRYSVLTPVGLLPIAIAGIDIQALVEGARNMAEATKPGTPFNENPAGLYAAARNALYAKGKRVEILVSYEPSLTYLSEWWKQLYGESEGKGQKGIFPASANFTTDLHSIGQYIQDGERILFETVLSVKTPEHELHVPEDPDNLDKLNYLAGMRMHKVNKRAERGTRLAHVDGGVPNIRMEIDRRDAYDIGELFYFFEKACGISGYILDVNPFDQPGVEAYKSNMFALLGKPGFEAEAEAIKNRL